MAWIGAVLLAVAALLGIHLSSKGQRLIVECALAALLIGLAGYAWQGSPDLSGSPRLMAENR